MNKEKTVLLVDSGTNVLEALVKRYDMYVLSLQIIYPKRTYIDKINITPEEVYQCSEKEIPSTSSPNGATVQAIFNKIREAGYEEVLAVIIFSGLSGTYSVVRLLGEQAEGPDVLVLDTKNIGIGAGIQAIRVAELIETGLGWQELQQELAEEVANAKVFLNVATSKHPQGGGRINLITSILGNVLKLNPIISCSEEGIYYTVARSRGRKKNPDKTFELVTNLIGEVPRLRLAAAHGATEEETKAVTERLKAAFPQAEEIYFGTTNPALVVHTEPGPLGVDIQLLND